MCDRLLSYKRVRRVSNIRSLLEMLLMPSLGQRPGLTMPMLRLDPGKRKPARVKSLFPTVMEFE